LSRWSGPYWKRRASIRNFWSWRLRRAIADVRSAKEIVAGLQEIGVKVSIDDFGSGFSLLRLLSELPINKLKIDRLFIRELDDRNRSLVRAMVGLARHLGLEVLAGGVETDEQIGFPLQLDCAWVQGNRCCAPMEPGKIGTLLPTLPLTDGDGPSIMDGQGASPDAPGRTDERNAAG
jgi:predicted signal transduction protein with EAL and GGDEF domain